MKTLRQLLGGLVTGAVVITLIASGLVLTAGDLSIASLTRIPSPTASAALPISGPSPFPDASAALSTSPTVIWTPTLVPTSTCPRPPGWIDHLVAEGEDLPGIAARYGIDPVVLQVNNCLVVAFVTPNMVLFVPAPPTLPPTVTVIPIPTVVIRPTVCGPPLSWTIYRVRPGDTLSSIARATGTTVRALMLANCLPSDKIRVGQILYVPRPPIPIVTIPFIPTLTPIPSPSPTGSSTPAETLVTPEPTTPGPLSPSPPPTDTPPVQPPTDTPSVQPPTPSPTFDDPPATDTPPPTVPPPPTEPPATEPPPTDTPVPNVTP